MATTQLRRMTASELWAMSNDGFRYRLIEGALHRISSASPKHGMFAACVDRHLDAFVDEREPGEVFGAESGFRLARDRDTVTGFRQRISGMASGTSFQIWLSRLSHHLTRSGISSTRSPRISMRASELC